MSQLLGVAFSSPAVVPLLIDNTHFMIHTYDGKEESYKDYLAVREDRDKVVLVSSLRNLTKAHKLDSKGSVRVFMLFDRAEILSNIEGCTILDAEESKVNTGNWNVKGEKVTREELNTILADAAATDVPFTIPDNISAQAALLEPSLFDFVGQVLESIPKEQLPEDDSDYTDEDEEKVEYDPEEYFPTFRKDTAAWVCGINHKRLWIVRHKKKLVQIGADSELVLDLYRFCAEGQAAKSLWHAYHAMRQGVGLEDAAAKYEAHPGDLRACVELFPPEEEREYKSEPDLSDEEE